ncbi:hypothetical protein A2313_03580 [Candidatus Roizmanbacteria bacterium RIFOXYB2_FULL_41_10]|uniref:Uncharacterized protein n=1 Tax=Candidatus Roizmanbacteria bacterium RIFOXYA1_FULL_41_12 TaxID=1802082 RepID=A0A1F7KEM6_9BACT|nr:MAG: hypothetical protein A2209_02090 [Candidatus Roizmanbacteria bacterium RIFOXYA1_FULL_41_12]OGK67125.1 MAG: hypothetical protein A2377_00475 [Candidatus Roizmanbacteria bacterium RIFOXYB1_FULL_41_27]OGK68472.1 MAG: hypothetical protein A2262_03325 [Candidatus Roizmanbacteria bacterium RIFOXYA2_FULL_41_8]OGK69015.1 MAG: hypothetical protein A2313_03580 [Candidatus Roizmanbacteria bacterium RIFOXYB2_FULL_41_10]OGK71529.1 MAG: hypothetical protein A2403_00815 [Candidatus Roizmanbacteria bac
MIAITKQTEQLLQAVRTVVNSSEVEGSEAIDVSKTVSFFAIAYEKFRNVIEFKDEHIIRRNAINRIVSRRLAFNPELSDEGLSLAKEIAWAGYYRKDKIPEQSVERLQRTLDWYIRLRNILVKGEPRPKVIFYNQFIKDLLVCQIEEIFSEKESKINSIFLFYFYQILNPSIEIEGKTVDEKNLLFYLNLEQVFLKSDTVYLRYHLFKLIFEDLLKIEQGDLKENKAQFKKAFLFIDKQIEAPINRKIIKYLRNLRPTYLIFKGTILQNINNLDDLFAEEKKLKSRIEEVCADKYQTTKEKLSRAGIRSIIYIFLTKIIFVLMAEYPLMKQLGEEVDYVSLAINSLFPPFLMFLFVIFNSVPDENNTERIWLRIKRILMEEQTEKIHFRAKKIKDRNFLFNVIFWSFYFTTFAVTFLAINSILNLFRFHLTSKIIFFFFASAVSFFGYRISQTAKEYVVKEKESVFTPVVDFFLMPLVSVGKWLSSEISKINVLLFVFDFLIEAPFKVLFEVIEEWISFIRRRKEDII